MHINHDLIETAHLLSAMLLDVPNIAETQNDARRRPIPPASIISKSLRRMLEYADRQLFFSPIQNTKDIIIGGLLTDIFSSLFHLKHFPIQNTRTSKA